MWDILHFCLNVSLLVATTITFYFDLDQVAAVLQSQNVAYLLTIGRIPLIVIQINHLDQEDGTLWPRYKNYPIIKITVFFALAKDGIHF